MTTSTTTTPPSPTTVSSTRVSGVGLGAALRWEVVKLAALARTRLLLLGCLIAPPIIVAVLRGQRPPADTLYGRWVHDSGYAVPLLLLGFAAQWVFPLLTSLVAGDIFASEDAHGTWKTITTRSVSRAHIFWAKTIAATAFALLVLTVLATATIASSVVIVGTRPLVGLSGQMIAPHTALSLVIASWALAIPPLIGFTALSLLLSVRTRNPAVAVVAPVVLGLVMTLLGSLGGTHLLRRALLTTPLEAWHGLFTAVPFHGPIWQGLAVCAVWTTACLAFAWSALRRRDITGG